MAERAKEQEMEEFRKKIIEEERARLLQQHAPSLVGYLPKVRRFNIIFKKKV